jgi:RNA polymerase sigma-70 factor (ECF subfamily)
MPAPADPTRTFDRHDEAAMACLRRTLVRFAARELRHPELVEDAVQDTMLALFTGASRYRGDASFTAFAISVLRHKIADQFRARRREVAAAPEAIAALVDADASNEPPGEARGGGASRERFWRTLRSCLATLPETTRAAFVLRDVQEWSMAAVCAHLGATPTHVSVMTHRARAHVASRWPAAQR